jgi:UDP-glucuronate 4-epimerase
VSHSSQAGPQGLGPISVVRGSLPRGHLDAPIRAGELRGPLPRGRYAVTGAAGFIGSHLSERLLADGHEVVGIDNFSAFYDRALKQSNLAAVKLSSRFQLREADLATADVGGLLEGCDAVFHLAAQAGVRDSWGSTFAAYARDNIITTQRLLEALRARDIPAVMASSSSVYGDARRLPVTEESPMAPRSPYGLTKLAGEHMARVYGEQYGVRVVSLRYFTVYGPRQRPDMAFTRFLIAAATRGDVQVLGDGQQSRDFTYVSDAVDATVRAMSAPAGSVYNVGGQHPVTIARVLDLISSLGAAPLTVRHLPAAAGDVRGTWADSRKAHRELGWRPSVSLEDGLRAQYEWVRSTNFQERAA